MADYTQTLTVVSAGKEIKVQITSDPTNCNISASTSSSWITVNKSTSTGSSIDNVFKINTNTGSTERTGHVYISATTFDDSEYEGTVTKTFDGTIVQEKSPIVIIDQIGEIAYWDGSKIAFTPYSAWTSSLGTPLAVCVIPKTHYGKARYMSIKGVTSAGTASDTDINMVWGPTGDTSLTNYDTVPTWDNTIGGTVGTSYYGFISSDRSDFTGETNVIDIKTKYNGKTPYIPSPYAADGSLNAAYNVGALSDLNGKSNTSVLVGLGTEYSAANACYKYETSGTSAGQWYLPSMGELVYIMPRFEVINAALNKCGGVPIDTNRIYWSSTEYSDTYAYSTITYSGQMCNSLKPSLGHYVRPFNLFEAKTVSSITIERLIYPNIQATTQLSAPMFTYTIYYSDGSTGSTGANVKFSISYNRFATIDMSTGEITFDINESTTDRSVDVYVIVSKDGINATKSTTVTQKGVEKTKCYIYVDGVLSAGNLKITASATTGTVATTVTSNLNIKVYMKQSGESILYTQSFTFPSGSTSVTDTLPTPTNPTGWGIADCTPSSDSTYSYLVKKA